MSKVSNQSTIAPDAKPTLHIHEHPITLTLEGVEFQSSRTSYFDSDTLALLYKIGRLLDALHLELPSVGGAACNGIICLIRELKKPIEEIGISSFGTILLAENLDVIHLALRGLEERTQQKVAPCVSRGSSAEVFWNKSALFENTHNRELMKAVFDIMDGQPLSELRRQFDSAKLGIYRAGVRAHRILSN